MIITKSYSLFFSFLFLLLVFSSYLVMIKYTEPYFVKDLFDNPVYTSCEFIAAKSPDFAAD